MKSIFFIALAGLSAVVLNFAYADAPATPDNAELVAQVQNTDEATLRDAASQNAEQIRNMPNDLRAQGVDVSPEEQAHFDGLADQLKEQSQKPDFKNKVVASMKKMRRKVDHDGMSVLKALGYTGSAVFMASFSPYAFGADLVTGAILGRGAISTGSKNSTEGTLGGLGGALTIAYGYTGLEAIGFTLYGPILMSGLGAETVNGLICRNAKDDGPTQRDAYCRKNDAILRVIYNGSARAGEIIGDGIHRGILDTAHFIERPFRDKADDREDDLGR